MPPTPAYHPKTKTGYVLLGEEKIKTLDLVNRLPGEVNIRPYLKPQNRKFWGYSAKLDWRKEELISNVWLASQENNRYFGVDLELDVRPDTICDVNPIYNATDAIIVSDAIGYRRNTSGYEAARLLAERRGAEVDFGWQNGFSIWIKNPTLEGILEASKKANILRDQAMEAIAKMPPEAHEVILTGRMLEKYFNF